MCSFGIEGSLATLTNMITTGLYDLEEKEIWHTVSREAKDLIRKLMEVDPNKRLNAKMALLHPWVLSLPILYLKSMSATWKGKTELDVGEAKQENEKTAELHRYSNATLKERRLYRFALEASFQRISLH